MCPFCGSTHILSVGSKSASLNLAIKVALLLAPYNNGMRLGQGYVTKKKKEDS